MTYIELSKELLQRRNKYPDKKTFWSSIQKEGKVNPKEYRRALKEILSHSEKLKGEVISELILSKFDGEYTEKFKDLIS